MKDLTQRALLVSLTIKQPKLRAHAANASRQVASTARAIGDSNDIARVNKVLLDKNTRKDLTRAVSNLRTQFYHNTLLWDDNGWRILPVMNYDDFMSSYRTLSQEYDTAAEDIISQWGNIVSDARYRLGDLFSDDDYPNVSEIRARFSVDMKTRAIDSAGDFRVSLGDIEANRIQAQVEKRLTDNFDAATQENWQRLYDAVSHLGTCVKGYSVENGKVSGSFRNSTFDKVIELADLLPRLNITGDARLDTMARELINSFGNHDAETLRNDDSARQEVALSCDDILSKLSGVYANVAA